MTQQTQYDSNTDAGSGANNGMQNNHKAINFAKETGYTAWHAFIGTLASVAVMALVEVLRNSSKDSNSGQSKN